MAQNPCKPISSPSCVPRHQEPERPREEILKTPTEPVPEGAEGEIISFQELRGAFFTLRDGQSGYILDRKGPKIRVAFV